MITEENTVPYEIIALSLSTTSKEAMSALEPLAKGADDFEAIRFALGRMHYLGQNDAERLITFARLLYQYAVRIDYNYPDEFHLFNMDYEYEIAEVLGWTNENANKEFMEALSVFKKENSDRANWFVTD